MHRRVAVTGLGVISAIGKNVPSFWESLCLGRPGIKEMELVDRSDFRFKMGAEITDYDPLQWFDGRETEMLDRFAQFALIAAGQAVAQSSIPWTPELRARTAIVTGTSTGGQKSADDGFYEFYYKRNKRVNPLSVPRIMANAGASHISMRYGIHGPAWTVSTACSSSNHAIGQAFWMVRSGAVDCAIAGGSEAVFHFGFLKTWEAMRVVSTDTCRPFSLDRKGLILGEGGAMLVLEPLDSALARGAPILAELAGFGMSADAHHITHPSAEGAAIAMRAALADAQCKEEEIGYINAHGTGTAINDPTETMAIREVFGSHADRLAVSSTKSMHGHTLGAAGAIESVATILALKNGILPPTANYTTPDPQCDLDVVPNVAREAKVAAALSNSFAFGGLNAVLLFRSAQS